MIEFIKKIQEIILELKTEGEVLNKDIYERKFDEIKVIHDKQECIDQFNIKEYINKNKIKITYFSKDHKPGYTDIKNESLIINLNINLSLDERRYAFLHELGHIILGHISVDKEPIKPNKKDELECDLFAEYFYDNETYVEVLEKSKLRYIKREIINKYKVIKEPYYNDNCNDNVETFYLKDMKVRYMRQPMTNAKKLIWLFYKERENGEIIYLEIATLGFNILDYSKNIDKELLMNIRFMYLSNVYNLLYNDKMYKEI